MTDGTRVGKQHRGLIRYRIPRKVRTAPDHGNFYRYRRCCRTAAVSHIPDSSSLDCRAGCALGCLCRGLLRNRPAARQMRPRMPIKAICAPCAAIRQGDGEHRVGMAHVLVVVEMAHQLQIVAWLIFSGAHSLRHRSSLDLWRPRPSGSPAVPVGASMTATSIGACPSSR
jgi:hypothetical protein